MPTKTIRSATNFFTMGCDAKCIVYGPDAVENRRLFEQVQILLGQVTKAASFYDPDSEINRIPRGEVVKVSKEISDMLHVARSYHLESRGYFDVTMGTVKALWLRTRRRNQPPSKEHIREAFQSSGMDKIHLGVDWIRIDDPSLRIDLSGVAKGYGIDACIDILKASKIQAGLVNVGGDMAMFSSGSVPGPDGWRVEIQDPRPKRKSIGYINEASAAIATSGNTKQYIQFNNSKLGHIVNPETKSFETGNNIISVTIVDKRCTDADIIATTVVAMGLERGLEYLKGRSDSTKYLILNRLSRKELVCYKNLRVHDFSL